MSEDGDEDAAMREKREMLEKIKDAANGPEHAKRRIEALDKMVNALKSRRRACGERQALALWREARHCAVCVRSF